LKSYNIINIKEERYRWELTTLIYISKLEPEFSVVPKNQVIL